MDLMEMRRGLLMAMAKQVQNLDNLFSNVQLNSGYIQANGTIMTAGGTTKEIHTDFIDTSKWSAGDAICIVAKFPTNSSGWLAVAEYDENGTFLSRVLGSMLVNNAPTDDAYLCLGIAIIPSTAKNIKLTARTYGGSLFACKAEELSEALLFRTTT